MGDDAAERRGMFLQRMAGEVKAEDFLFSRQLFPRLQFGEVGQGGGRGRGGFAVEFVEQRALSAAAVDLDGRAGLQGFVQRGEQLRATAEGVQRAGLDQRLADRAAALPGGEPLAEVEEIAVRPVRFPFGDDGVRGAAAATLDRREGKGDLAVADDEIPLRCVQVGAEDGDVHPPAVVDVLGQRILLR